ncbi:MAG: ABC transporter substrate-binding protein [Janthinobacterium lividum]
MPLITRRSMLAASTLGAATMLAGTPGRAQAPQLEDALVIRTTGGVFEAALKRNFFDPFTKATGVRVIPVAASDAEMQTKATAMAAAGRVEWDIISPQMSELPNLSDLLVDLGDCSAITNMKGTPPGTCGRYGVLYLVGAQVLAYDTRAFGDRKPQRWADFWNVRDFPGRRALSNSGGPFATIISALIADGVPRDKLFPLDLDRAFRKLDEIRPHIAVWWRTGDQSQAMWRNDDIALSLMWCGRAFATKKGGFPLAWSYDDTVADFGAWAILKNCPHPKAAMAFINFYLGETQGAANFSREMGYTTPDMAATALLTPEEKGELITTPQTMAKIIQMDPAWVSANRARTLERWSTWISS